MIKVEGNISATVHTLPGPTSTSQLEERRLG